MLHNILFVENGEMLENSNNWREREGEGERKREREMKLFRIIKRDLIAPRAF